MPLLLLLLISLSCGDEQRGPNEPLDLRATQTPIVYGEHRDVEQSRGQWRHAEAAVGDPRRLAQLTQTALATRATTAIRVNQWTGENCDELSVEGGSGFLTSSTRMLTARHVIAGHRRDTPIQAFFESSRLSTDPNATHTGFVLWDDSDEYEHDRTYPYTTKFDSSAPEQESPFLSNRLVQLGLRSVPLITRNELRGPWTFEVTHDHFEALSDDGAILDAALLRARPLEFEFSASLRPEDPHYVATGGFPLRAPGVFFDSHSFAASLLLHCPEDPDPNGECPVSLAVDESALPVAARSPVPCLNPTQCIDGATCRSGICVEESSQSCSNDSNCPTGFICIGQICHQESTPTPLWMHHHNAFPGEPGEGVSTANLVSNPYPFVVSGKQSDPEKGVRHFALTSMPASICMGQNSVPVTFGDMIQTTLDSLAGSSGGALLHALRTSRPSGVSEHRFAIAPTGVMTGISNEPGELLVKWSEPVGERLDHLTMITMVSPILAAMTSWDDSHDGELTPGMPTPVQPPYDQDPPRCIEHGADGRCVEFQSSFSGTTVFPDFPDQMAPFVWPDSHGSDDSGFPDPDGTEASHESKNPNRWVQCGVSHPLFSMSDETITNAGIGVGFLGSLGYNPDETAPVANEGSTVGLLRLICTPWSSVPFVTHWNLLNSIGTSSRNSRDQTAIVPRLFGTLAHSLATIAEWRLDEESGQDYLRPVSMKTCPPNYFLNGVDFHVRPHPEDASRAIVGGITALRCRASRRPHNNEEIDPFVDVNLYEPDDVCPHEFGDRCFSTGQQIGWSRRPSLPECEEDTDTHCLDTTYCATDEIAIGFAYRRESDGFISNLAMNCTSSIP